MPAQGRGGPSKRPVSVDAFVVDDSGAPEPPRQCPASVTHQYDVSATIKPMRRTDMCTEKEYKPKATEACVAAAKSMQDTLFPAWTDRFDEREAFNCGKFRAAGVTKVSDLYDWKLAKNANQPYPFEPHMDTLLKYTLSCGCL